MSSSEYKNSAPIESPELSEHEEIGDYICPSYSATGKQTSEAKLKGTKSALSKRSQAIIESAIRSGATLLPEPVMSDPKPKKRRKQAAVVKPAPEPIAAPKSMNTPPIERPEVYEDTPDRIEIAFSNAFGKIYLVVQAVLEEDAGFCLIFKDRNELRFIPKAGERLDFIHGDRVHNVFFPDLVFTGENGKTKMMILVKVNKNGDENETE